MELNTLSMQLDREHDACGIFARIEKDGRPSSRPVQAGLQALYAMRHRAGYVVDEGDGCGLLVDIPRALWTVRFMEANKNPQIPKEDNFYVGHFFVPSSRVVEKRDEIGKILEAHKLTVELVLSENFHAQVLGPLATEEGMSFLQIAGLNQGSRKTLFQASAALEEEPDIHVASLGSDTVVYKVVGDDETLSSYYPDLAHKDMLVSSVVAHTRYSTNTKTSITRVQPFHTLGHNGEINTILRFFEEAQMIGIPMSANFSDSQMVDRVVHAMTQREGWSLFEVSELLFPPIIHEIKHMEPELSDLYMHYRALWGPFSQGPAGVILRTVDEAVFQIDALGLRPMWLLEVDDAWMISSEQGIVPPEQWTQSPKPLAPGEKIGVRWIQGRPRIYFHEEIQNDVLLRGKEKFKFQGRRKALHFSKALGHEELDVHVLKHSKPLPVRLAAFGFREDDLKWMEQEAETGAEPIKSLGFDSPLAVLDDGLPLVSDFLHETVAVVTNPAIDREREMEHFSTRALLGSRPSLVNRNRQVTQVELQAPLLFEALPNEYGVEYDEVQNLAHRVGILCYEDALKVLRNRPEATYELSLLRDDGETVEDALARFGAEAVEAVRGGASIVVLDDHLQFRYGKHVDPFLALAAVHNSLVVPSSDSEQEHLRRQASVVLRSGGIRNLHDLVVALGLGADAVSPYLLFEAAVSRAGVNGLENVVKALCKGLEKVISTLGIHELRGYARLFGAIGLRPEAAELLGIPSFCSADEAGYGFSESEQASERRSEIYTTDEKKIRRVRRYQLYPRIWKQAGLVAEGKATYEAFLEKLVKFEQDNPLSLRHVLGLKTSKTDIAPTSVDTTVDKHKFPFVISSMSFGSQGEVAYRAYAEAAYRMNIVCVNGEGGEMKELLHKYPNNRGRQIASGRFGVNAELCNDAYLLEIKIGQGAKPGEGGHLPGSKVTIEVANARNATPGVDLISPSNNHDIYSIEDLAQVIYELKQINPAAKVAVKVPIVPNIGTIAVGIAKAGADIITLSGFDGGTGAARAHAIQHVGLPMEIGVRLAHDSLCDAGLRNRVEVWADGGLKSGLDAMKAILLGANRVGFGTMAMIAIGCTSCRACHKDTCHVGIATQMKDEEEAQEKGLKAFVPQEFDRAVEQLVRFFTAIGNHLSELTAALGARRTQDLVGQRHLLEQVLAHESVSTEWLTTSNELYVGHGSVIEAQFAEIEASSMAETASAVAAATGTDGGNTVQSFDGGYAPPREIAPVPRALGTWESGDIVRRRKIGEPLTVVEQGVAGAGFAAFHVVGMTSIAYGGAQDGVGKGAYGGKVVVLKHRASDGRYFGGSVGKGFAYGAQRGLFIVQGDGDARFGIRLSGADVIVGGEVTSPLSGHQALLGSRANLKGFAFEYMTNGRALVLGDPGPWMCSGMTGGTVYLRLAPELGLTEESIRQRIAKGAKVSLRYLDQTGIADVTELLHLYMKELRKSRQRTEAKRLIALLRQPANHFLMIKPGGELTDQDIATE